MKLAHKNTNKIVDHHFGMEGVLNKDISKKMCRKTVKDLDVKKVEISESRK